MTVHTFEVVSKGRISGLKWVIGGNSFVAVLETGPSFSGYDPYGLKSPEEAQNVFSTFKFIE